MFGRPSADFPVCPHCGNPKKGVPVYRCGGCGLGFCQGCLSHVPIFALTLARFQCPRCGSRNTRMIARIDPSGYDAIVTRRR